MTPAARWLLRRVGRRGVALLILGTGKVCYGLGIVLTDDPDPRGLGLLTAVADLRCWGALWVVCGVITFCCAWVRVGRDALGFVAALLPPFVWGFAVAWSAATGEYTRGWTTAGWYATSHILMILWAASVPEYSVPHRPRRGERGG
jgi:hypothetical protein